MSHKWKIRKKADDDIEAYWWICETCSQTRYTHMTPDGASTVVGCYRLRGVLLDHELTCDEMIIKAIIE